LGKNDLKMFLPFKEVKTSGSLWRYAKRLWTGLGENNRPVIIVASDVRNPNDPATGIGECRASALITVCCGALGIRKVLLTYAHEILPEELLKAPDAERQVLKVLQDQLGHADVVLLGSGLTNPITKIALGRLSKKEPLLKIDSEQFVNHNRHCILYDGVVYSTKYRDGQPETPFNMIADYGYFLIRPNCFAAEPGSSARMIILGGAHTYGTQAAAEMIFTPQGAGEIVAKFGRRQPKDWSNTKESLTGLVEVSPRGPIEKDGFPAVPLRLIQRERNIRVIKPAELSEVAVSNPTISPTLSQLYEYATYGLVRKLGFESASYCGILILTFGLYYHNFAAITSGIVFYAVLRWIHKRNM